MKHLRRWPLLIALPALVVGAYGGWFLAASRPEPSPLDAKARSMAALRQQIQARRALAVSSPGDADARIELGKLYLTAGDVGAALVEAEAASRLAPASPAGRLLLGRALRSAGRPRESEQALRLAAQGAPPLPDARRWLGDLLVDRGQHAAAEAEYRAALRQAPDDPAILIGLARARHRQNAPASEVITLARGAVEQAPKDPDASVGLAGLLLQTEGKTAEARAVLRKAVALAPDHALAHHLLAVAALESSDSAADSSDAELEAATAVALDPRLPEPYVALARARLRLGRAKEALPTLHKSFSIYPTPECLYVMGDAYKQAGLPAEERHFRRMYAEYIGFVERRNQLLLEIRRTPKRPEPYLKLADSYVAVNQNQPALDTLRDLLRQHPHHPAATQRLAKLQARAPTH